MAPLQNYQEQIAALCRTYHVARLALFGSAATGAFDPDSSDYDFLVTFQPVSPHEHAEAFFALAEALEALLGRTVDLVEEAPITNPYFLEAVYATKVDLYAA
jgi:predicted nucleotidyltransferase